MGQDGWFEIDHFAQGVVRIRETGLGPLHAANMWLVQGRERDLLIDAGVGVTPLRPIVESLTSRPVICLLTHAHYDHIGGAWEFEDRRAHPLEARILADPTPEATLWQGWLTQGSFSRLPWPGFSMRGYALRPAPASDLVEDGTAIDLGGRVMRVLHVPGHSPGLVAVHDRSNSLLFTSDALYAGRMFFDLPGSDRAAARESLHKLDGCGARLMHPGHGDSFGRADLPSIVAAALGMIAGAEGTEESTEQ